MGQRIELGRALRVGTRVAQLGALEGFEAVQRAAGGVQARHAALHGGAVVGVAGGSDQADRSHGVG